MLDDMPRDIRKTGLRIDAVKTTCADPVELTDSPKGLSIQFSWAYDMQMVDFSCARAPCPPLAFNRPFAKFAKFA
jgi:hypothetical protein